MVKAAHNKYSLSSSFLPSLTSLIWKVKNGARGKELSKEERNSIDLGDWRWSGGVCGVSVAPLAFLAVFGFWVPLSAPFPSLCLLMSVWLCGGSEVVVSAWWKRSRSCCEAQGKSFLPFCQDRSWVQGTSCTRGRCPLAGARLFLSTGEERERRPTSGFINKECLSSWEYERHMGGWNLNLSKVLHILKKSLISPPPNWVYWWLNKC